MKIMKNVMYFLLGLMLMVCVSATTVSVMTVKPARPVSTVCFETDVISTAQQKIINYAKQGYIVKTVSTISTDSSMWYKIIVVMEKY